MLKTTKNYLSLILSAFCLTITTFNQEAYALNARASVNWTTNNTSSRDTNNDSGRVERANYTLGNQNTECGQREKSQNQRSYSYNSNRNETLALSDSCQQSGKVTRVRAASNMQVTEQKGSYFNWQLNLAAIVNRENRSPSGSAIARGRDPQFFGTETFLDNIFDEEITLEAGSSVFAEDEQDMARTTFSRESTVLENPIFSIEILALGLSSVDAIVNFNSDPSLTFSTTALDLEALLEDPTNGLGTNDGLLSDISFSYTLDLSQFDLTSEQTLSGGGQSFAESRTVPEPTSSLGFIALGAVGAVSTLKRKVQSSKEKS